MPNGQLVDPGQLVSQIGLASGSRCESWSRVQDRRPGTRFPGDAQKPNCMSLSGPDGSCHSTETMTDSATGTTGGPRVFEREHELVAALAKQHRRLWPDAASRAVRAERGYGRGVADLVVLDFDPGALSARLASRLPPVRVMSEALILDAVRRVGSMTIEDLEWAIPELRPAHVRTLAHRLAASGHLTGPKVDIRAADACRPLLRRVTAIEAKLDHANAGLLQADSYRFFADRVYLALPTKAASRLDRDEIAETGIGVIAVGDRGARIVIGARLRTPERPGIRCWCEEIELGELVGERRRVIAPFTARFATPRPEQLVPDPWSQQGVLDLRDAWRS